jgi:hypothetical protein
MAFYPHRGSQREGFLFDPMALENVSPKSGILETTHDWRRDLCAVFHVPLNPFKTQRFSLADWLANPSKSFTA